METNKGLIAKNAEQYAERRGVTSINWCDVVDEEKSESENWSKIKEKVADKAEKLDTSNEVKKKEREVEEEYIQTFQRSEEVDRFYELYNHFVKSIALEHHTAFMCVGKPGLGKTYKAGQVLDETVGRDKYEEAPAVSAPFKFYKELWKFEESDKEVLVLDDIEGLIKKEKALSLLKQATWSKEGSRMVGWDSSNSKLRTHDGRKVPRKFEFTGRIIMIFNNVPDNVLFDSLKSRCFYHELDFTYEQKIELMKAITEKGMDVGLDREARQEVFEWIRDVTVPGTEGLDLRTLKKAYRNYKICNEMPGDNITWKDRTLAELDVDEDLLEIRDIILSGEFDSVGARKEAFTKRTDKSGKTYERKRDLLEEKSDRIREARN